MNIRDGNGLVPIETGDPVHPYKLVPLPDWEGFFAVYQSIFPQTPEQSVRRNFEIMRLRVGGASLQSAGDQFEITKERVRQIEAKFLRAMRRHLSVETSSKIDSP